MSARRIRIIVSLVLALTFCCGTAFASDVTFNDVTEADWFYSDVMKAAELGIFEGADGNFFPLKFLNRAEMAMIISRLAPEDAEGQKKGSELYDDVAPGSWYDEAVGKITGLGIAEGTGDGSFSPVKLLTREQFAVMMYNFTVFSGLEGENKGEALGFEDSSMISPWASDAMDWAVSSGIMRGSGAKLFPKRPITRAEAAVSLVRWTLLQD